VIAINNFNLKIISTNQVSFIFQVKKEWILLYTFITFILHFKCLY